MTEPDLTSSGERGEVRLVPMTQAQADLLLSTGRGLIARTASLKRTTEQLLALAAAFDDGITEEDAYRAMHISGSYFDSRKKLRSAFQDQTP